MGLLSNIRRVFKDVAGAVKVAAPILAPLALGAGGFFAARFLSNRFGGGGGGGLAGILGGAGGGGSQAVVASNFATAGGCPAPGFQGNRSPFANPIFRNATSVGFNPNVLPARPQVAQNSQLAQLLQLLAGPTQQTTSFNQGAFGATVAPSFRPFSPSFRSGQVGFSGGFTPGISQGLAPRFLTRAPQLALPAPAPVAPAEPTLIDRLRASGFRGF